VEVPAGTADAHATARAKRWRATISRIAEIAAGANPLGLRFATRGPRGAIDDYRDWLQKRFFGDCMVQFNSAKELINVTHWPALDATGDEALDRLIQLIASMAGYVTEAEQMPPPVVLLAIHRATARAAAALVQSMSSFCEVIVAPHLEAAVDVRNGAQNQLDSATAQANAISRHVRLLERIATQPGWFAWADAFDPGRATAELVAHQQSSIGEVVAVVRTTFANVPEVAALPDALAFALAPAALTSTLWDPLRLERRIRAALRILTKASSTNPAWMPDPAPVAAILLKGHRQLSDQVGALGFLARSGASRKAMLMGSVAVYERFAEGPLRRFGSIFRQAAEVGEGRQRSLDAYALGQDELGPIMGSIERAAPVLTRDFSFLVRNAAAHYQFEITETGVTVAEGERKGRKRRDELSDDDFLERLFDLNELIVALEVALVAYVGAGSVPNLKAEIERIASRPDEQYDVLRAIAGLCGWVELTFARTDATTLTMEGHYLGAGERDPFVSLLSTIAGALGVFKTVETVVVTLRGTTRSCEYRRAILLNGPANSLVATARAGRAMADVLRQTVSEPRVETEAKLILAGPVAVLTSAIANNSASVSEVRAFCKWIVPLLESDSVDGALVDERDLIVVHLRKLDEAIGLSVVSGKKKDRWLSNAAANAMKREGLDLFAIQQRLRGLYP
jgi:hypothetical protein